eukprot:scaffold63701_cov65-Phaeocystis_antarctica.AAC.3
MGLLEFGQRCDRHRLDHRRLHLEPRRRHLLRRAAALRLRQEGLLPCGDEGIRRHAATRLARPARVWAERRLVEAVDPAERGGVGPLRAAAVQAAGRRLGDLGPEDARVALPLDHLHLEHPPRARRAQALALQAAAAVAAVEGGEPRAVVGRVELREDVAGVARGLARERVFVAECCVARHLLHVKARATVAVAAVGIRRAAAAEGIGVVDAHVAHGVLRVPLVDLERQLVNTQVGARCLRVSAGTGIELVPGRVRPVGAREWVQDHLEHVEEHVAERITCVHVYRDRAEFVLGHVVHGDVLGVPGVD